MVLGSKKAPAAPQLQPQAQPPQTEAQTEAQQAGKLEETKRPSAPSLPPPGGQQALLYAKATFTGYPGTKEIIFIPDDIKWTTKRIDEMLSSLAMQRPNLMLLMNDSSGPRLSMLNDEEVQMDAIDKVCDPDAKVDDKSLTVRKIMDNKIKDLVSAIIAALEQTKSCPVFSHWTGPLGQIVNNINNGGQGISTKILARYHLNEGIINKGGETHNMFQQLFDNALPLNEASVGAAIPVPVDCTWLAEKMALDNHKEWKDFCCYEDGSIMPEDARHPGSQFFAGADLYFMSYRAKLGGGIDFHSRSDDLQMNMSLLAPAGHLLISGRTHLYTDLILHSLEGGVPLVLVRHAGGVTGIWAEIVSSIVDVIKDTVGWQEQFAKSGHMANPTGGIPGRMMNVSAGKLLAHAMDVTKDRSLGKSVELPDVQQALFVAQNRHQLFLETVRVLDPLSHTPEQALEILSACFSSTYIGVQELGATSAQKDVIALAWNIHKMLETKAGSLRRWDFTLAYLGAVLAWVAIVSATSLDVGRACSGDDEEGSLRFCSILGKKSTQMVLEFLTIVVPAACSLIVTMAARFQFRMKWGQVKLAAAEIVQHIYLFRGGVDKYDVMKQGEEDEEISPNVASKMARKKFVANISGIQSQIRGLDSMDLDADVNLSERQIPAHIRESLYGGARPTGGSSERGAAPEKERLLEEGEASTQDTGDDGISAINAEIYHKHRILLLLNSYQHMMPSLTWKTDAIRLIIFLLGFCASMLGATHNSSWIPTVVGMTSMLEVLMVCHNMTTHAGAMSCAIATYTSINLQWSGLSNMDRRTSKFKEFLMFQTEQVALSVVAAWVGQSAASTGKMEGGSGGGSSDKSGGKDSGKGDEKKQR